MCRRTNCRDGGKPDWAGCGAHVEAVLSTVPRKDQCRCREDGTRRSGGLLAALFGGGTKPSAR
ncbi:hypothetical protein H8E07_05210 [bacterium]|nr:hypothetical protein [bacterium]